MNEPLPERHDASGPGAGEVPDAAAFRLPHGSLGAFGVGHGRVTTFVNNEIYGLTAISVVRTNQCTVQA